MGIDEIKDKFKKLKDKAAEYEKKPASQAAPSQPTVDFSAISAMKSGEQERKKLGQDIMSSTDKVQDWTGKQVEREQEWLDKMKDDMDPEARRQWEAYEQDKQRQDERMLRKRQEAEYAQNIKDYAAERGQREEFTERQKRYQAEKENYKTQLGENLFKRDLIKSMAEEDVEEAKAPIIREMKTFRPHSAIPEGMLNPASVFTFKPERTRIPEQELELYQHAEKGGTMEGIVSKIKSGTKSLQGEDFISKVKQKNFEEKKQKLEAKESEARDQGDVDAVVRIQEQQKALERKHYDKGEPPVGESVYGREIGAGTPLAWASPLAYSTGPGPAYNEPLRKQRRVGAINIEEEMMRRQEREQREQETPGRGLVSSLSGIGTSAGGILGTVGRTMGREVARPFKEAYAEREAQVELKKNVEADYWKRIKNAQPNEKARLMKELSSFRREWDEEYSYRHKLAQAMPKPKQPGPPGAYVYEPGHWKYDKDGNPVKYVSGGYKYHPYSKAFYDRRSDGGIVSSARRETARIQRSVAGVGPSITLGGFGPSLDITQGFGLSLSPSRHYAMPSRRSGAHYVNEAGAVPDIRAPSLLVGTPSLAISAPSLSFGIGGGGFDFGLTAPSLSVEPRQERILQQARAKYTSQSQGYTSQQSRVQEDRLMQASRKYGKRWPRPPKGYWESEEYMQAGLYR